MQVLPKTLRPIAVRGTLRCRRIRVSPALPTPLPSNPDIRRLSTSAPRKAEEDNTRILDALAKSPDFAKVMQTPAIVKAMASFVQIAQEEGIDINTRPTMPTMFKMATNPRIKAAILDIQQQCEAAGINLTKSNALEILNNLNGGGKQ
ncbi:hypothetical protein M408DRAFT_29433 [Serendipita vermifera MAFF 305830]|uniref:Uncharacterized protein n=1 Tax=Serendipita vermifera MAFF 305830 TaxID=933852 RepID=A0A0C3AQU2_SERVB|nr:hypothetical protein M408DRAFT_29433 [Serendipita vermifera MAFF 305830]